MPLLHLHLLQLMPGTDTEKLLHQLQTTKQLVLAAKPHYWVVKPSKHDVSMLTDHRWDLMILVHDGANKDNGPSQVFKPHVSKEYTVPVGIPSRLLADYPERNTRLQSASKSVPLTGSLDKKLAPEPLDSQNLELSAELRSFMQYFSSTMGDKQPVTMLNLLCFKRGGKESYAKYGQEFKQTGGRRGGDAKIVGNVIRGGSPTQAEIWWNEIALVQYPSIQHFCDMAAGEDYQQSNHKYRLPALEDTILLCTTELPVGRHAKL